MDKMKRFGEYLVAIGRGMSGGEKGGVNLASILVMGLGFVFIGVGFIVFQIFMTASESLLNYSYSLCSDYTAATFTGFADIVGIMPLIVLVGFMAAGVFAMYLGVRIGTGKATAKVDLGEIILLALAMIFLAIALIILPVTLDSISGNIAHKAVQIDTTPADGANTTAFGTTTNVTLTQRLWCCNVAEATTVTTNVSGDAPVTIVSYNCTAGTLLVGSLTTNQSRTAIVTYNYADNLASFTGVYDFLKMSPLLLVVSLLGGAVITGFFGLKRMGS